jgi:hypothetical protein
MPADERPQARKNRKRILEYVEDFFWARMTQMPADRLPAVA